MPSQWSWWLINLDRVDLCRRQTGLRRQCYWQCPRCPFRRGWRWDGAIPSCWHVPHVLHRALSSLDLEAEEREGVAASPGSQRSSITTWERKWPGGAKAWWFRVLCSESATTAAAHSPSSQIFQVTLILQAARNRNARCLPSAPPRCYCSTVGLSFAVPDCARNMHVVYQLPQPTSSLDRNHPLLFDHCQYHCRHLDQYWR